MQEDNASTLKHGGGEVRAICEMVELLCNEVVNEDMEDVMKGLEVEVLGEE